MISFMHPSKILLTLLSIADVNDSPQVSVDVDKYSFSPDFENNDPTMSSPVVGHHVEVFRDLHDG